MQKIALLLPGILFRMQVVLILGYTTTITPGRTPVTPPADTPGPADEKTS
jgi:hypothetical protein